MYNTRNNDFSRNGFNVFSEQDICFWTGNYRLPECISADETRYCAFAIGFWGFHFFRASVENDLSIKNESLAILMSLLKKLGIDKMFRGNICASKPHSFIRFKKTVIKRISLNLGDSLGTETQWTVLSGFNAAFIFSSLVGLLEQNDRTETADCLKTLTYPMRDLVESARKAKLGTAILDRITQSQQNLKNANCVSSARNLYKILYELLVTTQDPSGS
ncbi:MAG: hypothetical protein KAS23_13905 [Anaerohalosphaera sp.]|nr:hypothetical protein [Anaerohalosphaera sp.]